MQFRANGKLRRGRTEQSAQWARRQREVIRRFAQGDADTDRLPVVANSSRRQIDPYYDEHLGEVLDLAGGIGSVMMASGMSAADTTVEVEAICEAYARENCAVDVTYNVITIGAYRGPTLPPATSVHSVRSMSLDFSRLAAIDRLSRRIRDEKMEPQEARAELDVIAAAPHPYKRWIATLAWGALAFAVAATIGGSFLVAGVSALSTMAIYRTNRWLNKRRLPVFFQHVVGGVIATAPAMALFTLSQVIGLDYNPTTGIAAGLVVLFAGLALVGSVQDAIKGAPVTAAGRFFELLMLTGATVAGVAFTLVAVQRWGAPVLVLEAHAPPALGELPLRVMFGGATSVAFALACYAERRALLAAFLGGTAGITVFFAVQAAGLDLVAGSFVAAVLVGLVGAVLARRSLTPPLVVAVAGITPLLPGLSLLHGLYGIVSDDTARGFASLLGAMAISTALAAGVTLGEWVATLTAKPSRRV